MFNNITQIPKNIKNNGQNDEKPKVPNILLKNTKKIASKNCKQKLQVTSKNLKYLAILLKNTKKQRLKCQKTHKSLSFFFSTHSSA